MQTEASKQPQINSARDSRTGLICDDVPTANKKVHRSKSYHKVNQKVGEFNELDDGNQDHQYDTNQGIGAAKTNFSKFLGKRRTSNKGDPSLNVNGKYFNSMSKVGERQENGPQQFEDEMMRVKKLHTAPQMAAINTMANYQRTLNSSTISDRLPDQILQLQIQYKELEICLNKQRQQGRTQERTLKEKEFLVQAFMEENNKLKKDV